ncbi:MAG: winged helix-turn-helix transcriptional regulator [Burkholderiales bacterium]|nr:winged helix-turn-helix transcriptional regulator [Burkholderiales bacterium]
MANTAKKTRSEPAGAAPARGARANGRTRHAAAEPEVEPIATPQPREHTTLWDRPGFLVRRLHQIHVAMFMEDLGDEQVTPIQYGLLSILVDMPGLDQFSLAEELGIDRANVADVLKRLESRKLVLRVVDPHNRRRKICLPTRAGTAFVQKYKPRMQRAQERLIEPLSLQERRTFVELLHKLIDANNAHGRAALRPSRGLHAGAATRGAEG